MTNKVEELPYARRQRLLMRVRDLEIDLQALVPDLPGELKGEGEVALANIQEARHRLEGDYGNAG